MPSLAHINRSLSYCVNMSWNEDNIFGNLTTHMRHSQIFTCISNVESTSRKLNIHNCWNKSSCQTGKWIHHRLHISICYQLLCEIGKWTCFLYNVFLLKHSKHFLQLASFTHSLCLSAFALQWMHQRAMWGSGSCPRILWHANRRSQRSNHQPWLF